MSLAKAEALAPSRRRGPVARILLTLVTAFTRHRQRAQLARLDAHILRDIGLSPDEAEVECAKPFWRP